MNLTMVKIAGRRTKETHFAFPGPKRASVLHVLGLYYLYHSRYRVPETNGTIDVPLFGYIGHVPGTC